MSPRSIKHVLFTLLLLAVSNLSQAGEVTVSAAASLSNAFKEIAQEYEARYTDSKVLLNFGASGSLLQQISKGAPVDVFAAADQETMDDAEKQGLIAISTRKDFVKNTLVLIIPADSKLLIEKLEDLNLPAVQKVAIGNPASVPAGRYARQALEAARLWSAVQTKTIHTQNVRQSLDYVARGEVEAGFVYGTDAALMKDKVKTIFTVSLDTTIRYPIAEVTGGRHSVEAKRFIEYVQSPAGQAVLGKYGFLKP